MPRSKYPLISSHRARWAQEPRATPFHRPGGGKTVNKRRRQLLALWHRQHGRCHYCKERVEPWSKGTVDHYIAKWHAANLPHNKVMACDRCNNLKGPMDGNDFKAVRFCPVACRHFYNIAYLAARAAAKGKNGSHP